MAVQCRERVAEWTTQTLSIKNVQRKVYSIFAPPQHHRTRTPSTGVHLCPTYPGNWFSLSILLGTPNTDNSLFLSIIIKMVQPILYIATAPPHTPLSPSLRTTTQFTTRSLSRSLPEDSVQQRFQFINTIYMSICAAPHSSRPYSLAHSLTHSLMLHPVRPFIPSPCAHNRPGPFRSICCC